MKRAAESFILKRKVEREGKLGDNMFLSDEEYAHVMGLLDGTIRKTPLLDELADWAKQEMGVDVYAYFCDYAKTGLLRLKIVLWDLIEKRKLEYHSENEFGYDPEIQKKFQAEFAFLSCQYGVHHAYQNNSDFWVSYETIEDEIQKKILRDERKKILGLASGQRDIWKIEIIFSGVHFFYKTDEQIQLHETDGMSDRLRQCCMDIVRDHDKFGVFLQGVPCVFTSKQTLDEKYAGSMFNYTR